MANYRNYRKIRVDDYYVELKKNDREVNNMDSYIVYIYYNNIKIEVSAEMFLYRLNNNNVTNINEDFSYLRNDLWKLTIICKKNNKEIVLSHFVQAIDKIKKILVKIYKFDSKILEVYNYHYLEDEFKLYERSFYTEKKACEMFYNYRLVNDNQNEFFDKYILYDYEEAKLPQYYKKRGGEFYGVYTDEYGRKRPLTSRVEYVPYYSVKDKLLFKAYMQLPKVYIKYVIENSFANPTDKEDAIYAVLETIMDKEIYSSDNGMQKAIKYYDFVKQDSYINLHNYRVN